MKTIFKYKGKEYSYIVIDEEVVVFRLDRSPEYEDDDIFDEGMKQQLEEEFKVYEATLTADEMKVWRGDNIGS